MNPFVTLTLQEKENAHVRALRALIALNGPDQPHLWAQKLQLSSDLGLSQGSAGLQFSHGYGWWWTLLIQTPTCRLAPWFFLSPASSLQACQVVVGPDPDLQIDFQAWLQTDLVSVLLIWTDGWTWLPLKSLTCSYGNPCCSQPSSQREQLVCAAP